MRALPVALPRAPYSLQAARTRSQGLSESADELILVMQRDADLRRLVTDKNVEERVADVENHVSALLKHEQIQAAEAFLVHVCHTTSWRISPRAFLGVVRSMIKADPNHPPPARLFAAMEQRGLSAARQLLNFVVVLARHEGKPAEAEQLLSWLPPGTRSEMEVQIVMSAYGSKGDIESMNRVLKRMGDKVSSAAHNILQGAMLKKGKYKEAFAHLEVMRAQLVVPGAITYLTFFTHLARRPGTTPPLPQLNELRAEMKKDKVKLTPEITDCLLRILVKGGATYYAQARAVFAEALADGVRPDVRMYTALINTAMVASEWEEVEGYLREMRTYNVEPDRFLYNALTHRAAEAGQLELAAQWKAEMEAAGFRASDDQKSASFTGILKGGPPQAKTLGMALSQLRNEETPQLSATKPPREARKTYFVAAHAGVKDTYASKKKAEIEAVMKQTEQELVARGPDAMGAQRNLNALVKFVARAVSYSAAYDLVMRLREAGFYADVFTYTLLLQACARQLNADEKVHELLKEMERNNVKPNAMTCMVVATHFARRAKPLEAEKWAVEMERRMFGPPDSRLCRALVLSFGSVTAKLDPTVASAKVAHWQERLKETLKREKASPATKDGDEV